jgi:hypothetical protein
VGRTIGTKPFDQRMIAPGDVDADQNTDPSGIPLRKDRIDCLNERQHSER